MTDTEARALTRDAVLTMEAGPEMDALVAERLMAWGWYAVRIRGSTEKYRVLLGPDARYWQANGAHSAEVLGAIAPPRYSTEMGAAWQVNERMREHPNPRFRTLRLVAYPYSRTYATFDTEIEDDWTEANGEHATPLAICRAALLTTLEDTND